MTDGPLEIAQWGKLLFEVGIVLANWRKMSEVNKNSKLQEDDFLIYDADFLLESYKAEPTIAPGVPYAEMMSLMDIDSASIRVDVMRGDFVLKPGSEVWNRISDAAFLELQNSQRIGPNEPMIHLRSAKREGNRLLLRVQKAAYNDQAKSNLILDWPASVKSYPITLRNLLSKKYKAHLPDLGDRRLANTAGVACLLFYLEDNCIIPYLVRRVEKVGVYPGGLHCTASGAPNWISGSKSFDDFFSQAMYQELDEEVGVKARDIVDLRPISLCRDFLRGGKPQIFFAGFTNLSRSELRKKRGIAADIVKRMSGWEEVKRDKWVKSSDVVIPPSKLESKIRTCGMTLEGIGAYIYGRKYIEKYGRQFVE